MFSFKDLSAQIFIDLKSYVDSYTELDRNNFIKSNKQLISTLTKVIERISQLEQVYINKEQEEEGVQVSEQKKIDEQEYIKNLKNAITLLPGDLAKAVDMKVDDLDKIRLANRDKEKTKNGRIVITSEYSGAIQTRIKQLQDILDSSEKNKKQLEEKEKITEMQLKLKKEALEKIKTEIQRKLKQEALEKEKQNQERFAVELKDLQHLINDANALINRSTPNKEDKGVYKPLDKLEVNNLIAKFKELNGRIASILSEPNYYEHLKEHKNNIIGQFYLAFENFIGAVREGVSIVQSTQQYSENTSSSAQDRDLFLFYAKEEDFFKTLEENFKSEGVSDEYKPNEYNKDGLHSLINAIKEVRPSVVAEQPKPMSPEELKKQKQELLKQRLLRKQEEEREEQEDNDELKEIKEEKNNPSINVVAAAPGALVSNVVISQKEQSPSAKEVNNSSLADPDANEMLSTSSAIVDVSQEKNSNEEKASEAQQLQPLSEEKVTGINAIMPSSSTLSTSSSIGDKLQKENSLEEKIKAGEEKEPVVLQPLFPREEPVVKGENSTAMLQQQSQSQQSQPQPAQPESNRLARVRAWFVNGFNHFVNWITNGVNWLLNRRPVEVQHQNQVLMQPLAESKQLSSTGVIMAAPDMRPLMPRHPKQSNMILPNHTLYGHNQSRRRRSEYVSSEERINEKMENRIQRKDDAQEIIDKYNLKLI